MSGIPHIEIRDSIANLVDNRSIQTLVREWESACEDLSAGRLPNYTRFSPEARRLESDHLMVLSPVGQEFHYSYYGHGIASMAGFDMTGRSTADFDGELGRWFQSKYRETLDLGRPLYTVHEAQLATTAINWERLILPVEHTDAAPRLVCYNEPLSSKSELFDGIMSASQDGIILFRPRFDGAGSLIDLQFLAVNPKAAEIVGRSEAKLVGRRLSRVMPGVPGFEACARVWQTGQPHEFETAFPRLDRVFRVALGRAGSKLIVTLSDITHLRQAQERLEQQHAELVQTNDILQEQAASLVELAEDKSRAEQQAREAQENLEQQHTELLFANETLQEQANNLVELAEDKSRAENAARQAQRFTSQLLEAVPLPLYYRLKDGTLGLVNSSCAELFDSEPEHMSGRPLADFLPVETVSWIDRKDAELYAGPAYRQSYEVGRDFPNAPDRRILINKAAVLDDHGTPNGVIVTMADMTEQYRLSQELERLATTDPLTGLYNRRAFMERAEEVFARVHRHGHQAAIVILDIDHFKHINDGFGHDVGDKVLIRLAEILNASLRRTGDLAARLGGEEFVLLLPDVRPEGAVMLSERLRAIFEETKIATHAGEQQFTASFGVAAMDRRDDSVEHTLKRADQALYLAKNNGRNQVRQAAA